jgi:hypothetical protein
MNNAITNYRENRRGNQELTMQSPTTERTEEEIKNEQCNHQLQREPKRKSRMDNHQLQREPKRKSRMNNAITNYRENRRGNHE